MSVFDEFKQELRARLRIVSRDLPHTEYEFRHIHSDPSYVVVIDLDVNDWTNVPIENLIVPVGTEECVSLRQALEWIESMENFNDNAL